MCMHDPSITEYQSAVCQGFPRRFESHKQPSATPKGLSYAAHLIAICLSVALNVIGFTILRTSWPALSTEYVAVAGLEPTSASTSTELHDTLPKIVLPHLAVSIPESCKKVVAIVPLARTSAPTPAEHSHDVLSTIIVPHVAVSIPKTGKKVLAPAPRSDGWHIFLPPSDPQHRSPDVSAPFKHWAQGEPFGSAEDCEHYRARVIGEAASDRDHADGPTDALVYKIKLFSYAECVSAQDRRIKEEQ
jgi:hypothetical protein